MKKAFLYLVFVVLLSCGESEEDPLLLAVNTQYEKTIVHYQEDIKDVFYQFEEYKFNVGYKKHIHKTIYFENISFQIDSIYQNKINQIIDLKEQYKNNLNSYILLKQFKNTQNNDILIEIQNILNFNILSLAPIFIEPDYVQENINKDFERMYDFIVKKNKTNKFNSFNLRLTSNALENEIIINEFILKLLEEELLIISTLSSYTVGIHGNCYWGVDLNEAFIKKNIAKPLEENYLFICTYCEFFKIEYYINNEFIEETYSPIFYHEFKSKSNQGVHSLKIKAVVWYYENYNDTITRTVDYQVVN